MSRAARSSGNSYGISDRISGGHFASGLAAFLALLALLIGLAGCQAAAPQAPQPAEGAEASPAASATPAAAKPRKSARNLSAAAGEPASAAPTAPTALPAGETPLRFTLPTPGPVPISLWRPPLYDTPWALSPYDHFYFSRPIETDKVNWPLADYRYGGVFFSSDIVHTGIDIPTPRFTPVIAAASGKVIWAGYGLFSGSDNEDDPYGLAVTIRHDFGYNGQRLYTAYAHLDQVRVVTGQEVKTGDLLGLVGTTGLTTGPHLHFEVRMERNSYFATFNPELWLAPPQGWGVLAGRLMNANGSLLSSHDVTVINQETRQKWSVRTYGNQAINPDPYYNENLVLSDLPAGRYDIIIDLLEERYTGEIEIFPGAVSYFKFRGKLYFDTSPPPAPVLSLEALIGEQ